MHRVSNENREACQHPFPSLLSPHLPPSHRFLPSFLSFPSFLFPSSFTCLFPLPVHFTFPSQEDADKHPFLTLPHPSFAVSVLLEHKS